VILERSLLSHAVSVFIPALLCFLSLSQLPYTRLNTLNLCSSDKCHLQGKVPLQIGSESNAVRWNVHTFSPLLHPGSSTYDNKSYRKEIGEFDGTTSVTQFLETLDFVSERANWTADEKFNVLAGCLDG